MEAYWVAFITGLTTGGLSCMLVQGGLVTGSLARQVENDLAKKSKNINQAGKPQLVMPILIFLTAKLAAYTILGFLLGWIGTALSLTPVARGILLIAIALFMIGNALRMFNVHPIFRYFTFEPPSALTRMIRRKSKESAGFVTPMLLGFLTILIPCGVTQAMMAVAISTSNPLAGALTMFAFILGTSPVFFVLTYLATKLSSLWEKSFTRVVAIALLIFGLISMDNGLNLVGSPFTLGKIPQAVTTLIGGQNPSAQPAALSTDIKLDVTNNGYFPELQYALAGQPVKLHLVTDHTTACSLGFTIPAMNYQITLPQTGEKVVDIPAQSPGTTLHYSCSMGMYTGDIVFQEVATK